MATITLTPTKLLGAGVVSLTGGTATTPVDGSGNPLAGPHGTPLLDSFNRPDGDPGSSYVGDYYSSYAKPAISSNQLVKSGAFSYSSMRTTTAYARDSEVWGTPYRTGGEIVRLTARSTETVGAVGNCYEVMISQAGLDLYKRVDGDLTSLGSYSGPSYVPTGTPTALSCLDNTVTVRYWNGSAWVSCIEVLDEGVAAGGHIGLLISGQLDNFGGGSVSYRQLITGSIDACELPNARGRSLLLARSEGGCTLEISGTEYELAAETDYVLGPFQRSLYGVTITATVTDPVDESVRVAAVYVGQTDGHDEEEPL